LQALWYWIAIFQYKLMGRINESVRTHDLYETLLGERSSAQAFRSNDLLLQFPEEQFLRSIEDETYTKKSKLVMWNAQLKYDRTRHSRNDSGRGRKRKRGGASKNDWGGIIANNH